jgi:hypothetical protein
MAVGYQGIVFLNGSQFLVTNGGIQTEVPVLRSEGTYAANRVSNGQGNNVGAVDKVHLYDWDSVTGSLEIEANYNLVNMLFGSGGWVDNRDESMTMIWYNNINRRRVYGDVFWTDLTLSTDEGSLVRCDLQFKTLLSRNGSNLPVERFIVADDYIDQKFGIPSIPNPEGFSHPLWFGDGSTRDAAIPFWKTQVFTSIALPLEVMIKSWEIHLTNPYEERFTCGGSTVPDPFHPGPSFIFVGTAEVTLSLTLVLVSEVTAELPLDLSGYSVSINLGTGQTITLRDVQGVGDNVPLVGVGDVQTYEYSANGFFGMPHL